MPFARRLRLAAGNLGPVRQHAGQPDGWPEPQAVQGQRLLKALIEAAHCGLIDRAQFCPHLLQGRLGLLKVRLLVALFAASAETPPEPLAQGRVVSLPRILQPGVGRQRNLLIAARFPNPGNPVAYLLFHQENRTRLTALAGVARQASLIAVAGVGQRRDFVLQNIAVRLEAQRSQGLDQGHTRSTPLPPAPPRLLPPRPAFIACHSLQAERYPFSSHGSLLVGP